MLDLLSILDTNTDKFNIGTQLSYNIGVDKGAGIELSYGNNGLIDGYLLSGNLPHISLNDPQKYTFSDLTVLVSKVSFNNDELQFDWYHIVDKTNINGVPLSFSTDNQISTTADCTFFGLNDNGASRIGTAAWEGFQDSDGDYIFPVSVNYYNVEDLNIASAFFGCNNPEFDTFFRSSDIFLMGFNNNDGSLFKAEHISHFSGEDFNAEVLETNEGHYVVNGAVSDDAIFDPVKYDNIENAGRLVFVNKANFKNTSNPNPSSVDEDYVFLESAADLCTFSTVYTTDGTIALCANNSANFDDYALFNICPGYPSPTPACACEDEIAGSIVSTITDPGFSWPGAISISGGIIVNPGATLTISNQTIKFTADAGILVKKGGKLILNNALLTNACPQSFWEGIEVEGSPNIPQPTSVNQNDTYNNHGSVFMQNNTIIENAVNAIANTVLDNTGNHNNYSTTLSNGIVSVSQGKFVNNINGVFIVGDNNTTPGKIEWADFIIDDRFLVNSTTHPNIKNPNRQVDIKNTVAFTVKNSEFDNQNETISAENAFVSQESTFYFQNNDVNNFKVALQAYKSFATTQQSQTLIKANTFYHNKDGIVCTGFNEDFSNSDNVGDIRDIGLYINLNTIVHRDKNYVNEDPLIGSSYGIRLDGCGDYIVSDNTITGGFSVEVNPNNYLQNHVGIQTTESVPTIAANYIQKNIFGGTNTELYSGVYAYGDNPTTQILCNNFEDYSMASGIFLYDANTTINVVAPSQGDCKTVATGTPESGPAGNALADHTAGLFGSSHGQITALISSNFSVTYNHAANNVPTSVSGNVTPNDCETDIEIQCNLYTNEDIIQDDDDDDTGGTLCCESEVMRTELVNIETEMQHAMDLLTKYNREDESVLIETANTIFEVEEIISEYDVYLSDNELIAVIGKLTPAAAFNTLNILEENAPLSNAVLGGLSSAINNLPRWQKFWLLRNHAEQIDQLYENTVGISLRNEKELEVYQFTVEQKYVVIPVIIYNCCRNSPRTVIGMLNFAALNTSLNKVWFQKQLVDYALTNNNTALANFTLNTIQTEDDTKLADDVALQQFKIDLQQQNKSLYELDENELATLEDMSHTQSAAGMAARNAVLAIHDSLAVFETPLPEEVNFKKAKKPVNPLLNLKLPENNISVYPNPATEVLFIDLKTLGSQYELMHFKLYNSAGHLLRTFKQNVALKNSIDISSLSQGIYYIEIIDEQALLINLSKVIVIQ